MDYSVLMTVYKKEKPEYLKSAIESMLNQTVPPAQFVLVCDGPLNPELDDAIESFGERLDVLRLEENRGPGYARSEGFKLCRYELTATLDSDDISVPDRCEKQLEAFENDPSLALVGGEIEEFYDDPDSAHSVHKVPLTHGEIISYSKLRNPFMSSSVMIKNRVYDAVGGFRTDWRVFEDYELWVRILQGGYKTANLPKVLVKMRTPEDFYKRRGGRKYAKKMVAFRKQLKRSGWINRRQYAVGTYPYYLVCIMPNGMRKLVFKLLRK